MAASNYACMLARSAVTHSTVALVLKLAFKASTKMWHVTRIGMFRCINRLAGVIHVHVGVCDNNRAMSILVEQIDRSAGSLECLHTYCIAALPAL